MSGGFGLVAGVEGKCSVAMFQAGSPAGTCDRPAYGEQLNAPFLGLWHGPYTRPPLAMGYCCEQHGGSSATDTRFMMDGNAWMAFRPGFENLQESVAGFGPTQAAAYDDMARNIAAEIARHRTDTPS